MRAILLLGDRGPMDTADELQAEHMASPRADDGLRIQPGGFLLELSPDWIVRRASENIHHLLHQSHATLIDEPLGRFVQAQALHDLRNLFSRLSGTTGIARAYAVRLTDDHDRVDIAFQLSHGRVLLEAVPSAGNFGECFGSVGGLIAGLSGSRGQALLDGGARRMRALTGYDRVTLVCGTHRAESSRGAFAEPSLMSAGLPVMVTDADQPGVALFPRPTGEGAMGQALRLCPAENHLAQLRREGVCASMIVPLSADGIAGEFRCDNRTACAANFELHAAAELFAQFFAAQLEIDGLKGG